MRINSDDFLLCNQSSAKQFKNQSISTNDWMKNVSQSKRNSITLTLFLFDWQLTLNDFWIVSKSNWRFDGPKKKMSVNYSYQLVNYSYKPRTILIIVNKRRMEGKKMSCGSGEVTFASSLSPCKYQSKVEWLKGKKSHNAWFEYLFFFLSLQFPPPSPIYNVKHTNHFICPRNMLALHSAKDGAADQTERRGEWESVL